MKKSILLFAATLFAAATFAQTPTVSASSVTFKYCETTDTAFTVYTLLPYTWRAQDLVVDFDEYSTTVHTLVNARGCDSIVSLTLKNPSLPGKFTVDNQGTQVQFSMGNLQYRATKNGVIGDLMHNIVGGQTRQGEWRFAEHQWDFISKEQNELKSRTYNGWVDLFAYASSGYSEDDDESGNHPFSNQVYWSYNLTGTEYDWGICNEISNGGPANCGWFTMNYSQFSYLLNDRNNAQEYRSFATVNGVAGVIILPDDWTLPASCSYTGNVSDNLTTNTYVSGEDTNDWNKMETAGAVFFPFQDQSGEYKYGYYFAPNSGTYAWYFDWYGSWGNIWNTKSDWDPTGVRLVHLVK